MKKSEVRAIVEAMPESEKPRRIAHLCDVEWRQELTNAERYELQLLEEWEDNLPDENSESIYENCDPESDLDW